MLLGLELTPYPYISGYGVLWRAMRLTCLERREIYSSLGLRLVEGSPVLEALQRPRAARHRFAAATGLGATAIADYWSLESWSPLASSGALDRLRLPLRVCPRCAEHGYHTMLFQLPSIECCPWHGRPLSDRCPQCLAPRDTGFAPTRAFGACACGFDPFRTNTASVAMWTFPTETADIWLSEYLGWAAKQREIRHLVAPEASIDWLPGFAELARPPVEMTGLPTSNLRPSVEVVPATGQPDPPAAYFWGWCALAAERPLTYVPLPTGTHALLTEITQEVAARLPSTITTPVRLADFLGVGDRTPLVDSISSRPDCFIAPHGTTKSGAGWLNVSVLDRETLRICGKLIDTAIEIGAACAVGTDKQLPCSEQAARTEALGWLPGRQQLAGALERILCRGYAQGLELVLGRLTGTHPPVESNWRLPLVEIEQDKGRLGAVRICWVHAEAPKGPRPESQPLAKPNVGQGKPRKPGGVLRVRRRRVCAKPKAGASAGKAKIGAIRLAIGKPRAISPRVAGTEGNLSTTA
jgi:hypothetical protein